MRIPKPLNDFTQALKVAFHFYLMRMRNVKNELISLQKKWGAARALMFLLTAYYTVTPASEAFEDSLLLIGRGVYEFIKGTFRTAHPLASDTRMIASEAAGQG